MIFLIKTLFKLKVFFVVLTAGLSWTFKRFSSLCPSKSSSSQKKSKKKKKHKHKDRDVGKC